MIMQRNIDIEWQGLARTMTPEKLAAPEAEDPDESANEKVGLGDEAAELMVRPDPLLDEDEDGTPGERLARDGYCELDEDRLRDQEREDDR